MVTVIHKQNIFDNDEIECAKVLKARLTEVCGNADKDSRFEIGNNSDLKVGKYTYDYEEILDIVKFLELICDQGQITSSAYVKITEDDKNGKDKDN
jgi:hypothetical protein